MRMVLEGVPLETTEYAEGAEIRFTLFTYDDGLGLGLREALASEDRVLRLRRGDEQIAVRVLEHEITPPYSRRFSGAIHRHSVRLAPLSAATPASLPYRRGAPGTLAAR